MGEGRGEKNGSGEEDREGEKNIGGEEVGGGEVNGLTESTENGHLESSHNSEDSMDPLHHVDTIEDHQAATQKNNIADFPDPLETEDSSKFADVFDPLDTVGSRDPLDPSGYAEEEEPGLIIDEGSETEMVDIEPDIDEGSEPEVVNIKPDIDECSEPEVVDIEPDIELLNGTVAPGWLGDGSDIGDEMFSDNPEDMCLTQCQVVAEVFKDNN